MNDEGEVLSNEPSMEGVASGDYEVNVTDSSEEPQEFTSDVTLGYVGQTHTFDDFESYEPYNEVAPQSDVWMTCVVLRMLLWFLKLNQKVVIIPCLLIRAI